MWFFGAPGTNFDFASFSFQVPICGSSANDTAAAAKKQSATINPVVFVFMPYSTPNLHFGSILLFAKRLPSNSHGAVIRVYDEAGNVIETHEHKGDFKEPHGGSASPTSPGSNAPTT